MLTPAFSLSQDEEYLTIDIKAPFARISDTEIFVEENEFRFHSKPYFLRLTLPGNIVEDGRESATYDVDKATEWPHAAESRKKRPREVNVGNQIDVWNQLKADTGLQTQHRKGSFVIRIPKETPGEEFDGLDMITKLLTPKGQTSAKPPLIEVIAEENNAESKECNDDPDDDCEEEEFDWQVEQHPFDEESILLEGPKYGFANQSSGIFTRLQEEICEIVDLKEPDKILVKDRHQMRLDDENSRFHEDYYLADLYQDEQIQQLLQYKSPWQHELDLLKTGSSKDEVLKFTEQEKEKMVKLPKKNYLIDENMLPFIYLGLVDLIFAFAYNHRTTEGENNVESSWNICKLSATLSWLEVFTNVEEVVISCLRRSLCYPLYRHWDLANLVLQDTQQILSLGKQRILKCLLEIHTLLSENYPRYILNDLYITDYCVWIQTSSDKRLESLGLALKKVKIKKKDISFDLVELEAAAKLTQEEENEDIDTVTKQISRVKLNGNSNSDKLLKDSDSESESSDESTTCDEECTDSDDEYSESDDVYTEIDSKDCDSNSCDLILDKNKTVRDESTVENKDVTDLDNIKQETEETELG